MSQFNISKITSCTDFIFAEHTTYGLGGRAKRAYFPQNKEEVSGLVKYFNENNIEYCVLGNGSDVLASDKAYDGAVICTKNLNRLEHCENKLRCGAGVTVGSLLKYCVNNCLGGLEYLAGIPATIGGLAYMNGGAGGKYIQENVESVTLFSDCEHVFALKDCNFGNKHSTMRNINCVITEVTLNTSASTKQEIQQKITERLSARAKLPKGRSCGCIFKNPAEHSAGKIIDECGLKGLRCGGAYVSFEHANFIINDGGSAKDVYRLINIIKQKVKQIKGINLEEEVVYIGEFNGTYTDG